MTLPTLLFACTASACCCVAFAQVSLRSRMIPAQVSHTYDVNACDLDYYVNSMKYTATNIEYNEQYPDEIPLVKVSAEDPRKLDRIVWYRPLLMYATIACTILCWYCAFRG